MARTRTGTSRMIPTNGASMTSFTENALKAVKKLTGLLLVVFVAIYLMLVLITNEKPVEREATTQVGAKPEIVLESVNGSVPVPAAFGGKEEREILTSTKSLSEFEETSIQPLESAGGSKDVGEEQEVDEATELKAEPVVDAVTENVTEPTILDEETEGSEKPGEEEEISLSTDVEQEDEAVVDGEKVGDSETDDSELLDAEDPSGPDVVDERVSSEQDTDEEVTVEEASEDEVTTEEASEDEASEEEVSMEQASELDVNVEQPGEDGDRAEEEDIVEQSGEATSDDEQTVVVAEVEAESKSVKDKEKSVADTAPIQQEGGGGSVELSLEGEVLSKKSVPVEKRGKFRDGMWKIFSPENIEKLLDSMMQ